MQLLASARQAWPLTALQLVAANKVFSTSGSACANPAHSGDARRGRFRLQLKHVQDFEDNDDNDNDSDNVENVSVHGLFVTDG